MSRLRWKQYTLTILESGEVRTLPATSDAIARDLARQRLAEDSWLIRDFTIQRDSYDATGWANGVVTISRNGGAVATLQSPSTARRRKATPTKPEQFRGSLTDLSKAVAYPDVRDEVKQNKGGEDK